MGSAAHRDGESIELGDPDGVHAKPRGSYLLVMPLESSLHKTKLVISTTRQSCAHGQE